MRKTLILLLLFISGYVYAQEPQVGYIIQPPDDIGTDRPDQTESTDILQPGYVQIETGVEFSKYTLDFPMFSTATINQTSFPGLIRIGVFPNMELRIAPEYYIQEDKIDILNSNLSFTNRISGFLPLSLGTKIKIVDESKYIPAMSFLFHVDIPKLASENLKAENPTPEVRFAFSKTLSDRFSFGVNLGASFSIDYEQTVGIYTASLAADLIEKLGGFIELYGFMADHTSAHIDGGFTYRILKNLQVDLYAGTGLTEDTPDFTFGGGLSVRLPR
jgi:hypothetical protein